MTSPGTELGISPGTDLADVYEDLLSDSADALSVSSDGGKVLVLPEGLIQSAAFQQAAASGEPIQDIENNASILADIGYYCDTHNIGVEVEAVLTPPDAEGFYTGTGTIAVNADVEAWATAAAVAALPITAIEDIQEVGTEATASENGVTPENLASIAASEALAVNTLITTYAQIASDALGGNIKKLDADAALPTSQSFVTANQVTLANQLDLIAQAYTKDVSLLTVGDMEAGGGSATDSVLQNVAQFWNDYDAVANSGTVELYGSWENIDGKLTQMAGGMLGTESPGEEIPNATTVWINGTIVDPSAFLAIINPGTIIQTGSVYSWAASSGMLPGNWVPPSGAPATPLYEILLSGTVDTYVYEQSAILSLNPAQEHLSFVTSDTGSGVEWQQWLQGLETLASGGTIQALGTTISIGSNPTLALNVLTEPYQSAISDTQMVQQAEHQAAVLAGFNVPIADLVNEDWTSSPSGVGPINSPASWTNAEAEIAALYPLYATNLITAEGSIGVAINAPGQIVLGVGNTVSLGPLSLTYGAADSGTARLGIVLIDLNGNLSLTGGSAGSGTFGSSGTFSGAGSNILVLNGDTADLALALNSLSISEQDSGPDTIDIETFGANGPLSDNEISLFATNGSVTGLDITSEASNWAVSSSTINNGTIEAEVLNWNTAISNTSSGASSPEFAKTDEVITTFADYDVFVSNGESTSGTSIVAAIPYNANNDPLSIPFSGGLGLVSQTTSLIVQSTTNVFDASGYLAQSVDTLLAPENIGGSDGSTLEPWGTQITVCNVPGNTEWNFGSQYSSATLTLDDQGQTIEVSFQGGPDGPANALFEVFNPTKTGDLWEEIQTTTAFNNSDAGAGGVLTIVTEFDTGDNPFWDSYDWGNAAGSVGAQIYGNGVTLPPNAVASAPRFIDVIGSYDTITGTAGSAIWVNGTDDVINLPGGTLNLWAESSAVVNGDDVTVWTVSAGTVTVTGSGDVVTGAPSTTINLVGNNDVAGASPGSTVTVGGKNEVMYGDSLDVVVNGSAAGISAQGNSNNIGATMGGSITVVGANDTITLGSAAITLNASSNDAVGIDDTAAGFVANLGELVAWNASGWLTGIILTDPGTPVISLSPTQIAADAAVINLIESPFTIDAISVSAADATTVVATAHVGAISVSDTTANVVANLSDLEALAASGRLQAIYLTDPGTPVISLTPIQITADAAVINLIDSPFTIDAVSVSAADAAAVAATADVGAVSVSDTAANVVANLSGLEALAASDQLRAVYLTDPGTPVISLPSTQIAADAAVIKLIDSPFTLDAVSVSAADAAAVAATADVGAVSVSDTAANVGANLSGLEALAASGRLQAVYLADPGTPVISLTPAQIAADAAVINLINSPFTIDAVSVSAAETADIAATAHVGAISVSDTAANVVANLSGLEALAVSGCLQAVYLTDPSTGVISLTPTQIAGDAAVINLIDGPFTLDTVSGVLANPNASDALAAAASISSTAGISAFDTSSDQPIPVVSQAYLGPVAGLQNEFIDITSDSINISVTTPNWFLHSGSGNDAIAASSGTNVLDGGTGSNFLVGGSGSDTFFADARGATAPIWDTVVNFHPGDSVTIWGVTSADFTFRFTDNLGATGYTGLTLTATAPGKPAVSVTFAGLTMAALNSGVITETFGTSGGSEYTYFHEMSEPEGPDLFGDKAVRRIVVPYGTTLSPRVLLGAMLKMPTIDIERTVEELIAELDIRCGYPDDEPEPEEPEPEEPFG